MAIPIRNIPILEGDVANRFLQAAEKAEKERGTINISENMKNFQKIREDARARGIFI
jgi:hypothetical protein